MRIGLRTPSPTKTFSALTTGRIKRSVKRAVIPGYGQKGMGWLRDPQKALYNKIYRETTVDAFKPLRNLFK